MINNAYNPITNHFYYLSNFLSASHIVNPTFLYSLTTIWALFARFFSVSLALSISRQ